MIPAGVKESFAVCTFTGRLLGGHKGRRRLPRLSVDTPPQGFPGGSGSKEATCSAGDQGSIPGSGKSPGEENGNPPQYSWPESPMDRGAWKAAVHESICLECWRPGFDPWVGKIPWRRKWQPTPVLLPGESHGGRSLVGYSPWGRKESDMTE